MKSFISSRRFWILAAVLAALIGARALGIANFLSLETLRLHRHELTAFVASHYEAAALAYVAIYILAVTFSVPGALLLTLAGGFFFGSLVGTALTVFAATIGAIAIYALARTLFGESALSRFGPQAEKLAFHIRKNAWSYLLVLRLVPLFPFFLVNLIPAFAGVSFTTFAVTTFFGIIPATAVFSISGAGLGDILEGGGTLSLGTVLTPNIIVGLSGLALLSLLAVPLRRRLGLMNAIVVLIAGTSFQALADPMLADFVYPFEVKHFEFTSQKLPLSMAYMDIAPKGSPNGDTAVLLHGKNFCAATWENTINALAQAGYRVIAPDQIGFCKSSKPEHYQYGFHQLAANTHSLLQALGVQKPIVMGHSTGGMLAFRYALMYPDETKVLVAVNPIGLEDWKAKGVPAATIDELYQGELKTTADSIRNYERSTYYAGEWKPEYDKWVNMLASMYQGKDGALFAWSQALTSDMIFMQPVVYEFGNIRVPTLLLLGEKDNTAIGKNRASPEVAKRLGNYMELGPETAKAIPGATLVMFPDYGHAPQIQSPDRFNEALLAKLEALRSGSGMR